MAALQLDDLSAALGDGQVLGGYGAEDSEAG